jgi:hypothetical protein
MGWQHDECGTRSVGHVGGAAPPLVYHLSQCKVHTHAPSLALGLIGFYLFCDHTAKGCALLVSLSSSVKEEGQGPWVVPPI